MRILIVSDIHANWPALAAIDEPHDVCLCLGDLVDYGPDPSPCVRWAMRNAQYAIRGNHDRWTVDTGLRRAGAVDRFARSRLSPVQLEWLAGLPATAQIGDEVFVCHGTPTDDEMPWLDNFYDGRTTTLPSEAEVAGHAVGIDSAVILCGHTHIARTLRLTDGRLIANPGSVGMQLVRGSPDAHYGIVEKRRRGWQTAMIAVAYDTEAAARLAEANGFPGWVDAIRHGWAGPETLS